MSTNINPTRIPIQWAELVRLCTSCGLTKRTLANNRFSFWHGNIGVIHQAEIYQGDQFKNGGYFNGEYGAEGEKWRGQPVTKRGQIRVIETIDPKAPLTKEVQLTFVQVVSYVIEKSRS
jgi:hypothetical protein